MNTNTDSEEQRRRQQQGGEEPEDRTGEPGAEGGSESPSADRLPGAPSEDSSEVGDTDQHSSA